MVKAEQRSAVRTLRKSLGLSQADFAKVVGISFHLIYSIELRRARLTWRTAGKIAAATGVSVAWLLGAIPVQPIKTEAGKPWTLDHFRQIRAAQFEIPASEDFLQRIQEDCMELIPICSAAIEVGRVGELRYEFSQFTDRMRKTYGLDQKVGQSSYTRNEPIQPFPHTTNVSYYSEIKNLAN